ncbi:HD domain-containing protein [Brevibacillus laterosporus]|nr:bis(5'-nucleosyl)-tetraphosphatase (symmetrical) YqeK [Brevibacillus laterosporus]TPG72949.1 HD domain-containing protein [Brevibacillus laterosporus]
MELIQHREALLTQVRSQMHEKRYRHTLGVAEVAKELAVRFGADPIKAELAGLLHDYCKCWEISRLRDYLLRYDFPQDLLSGDKELWHAFVGAIVVHQELKIQDVEILQAIRYHTTGRENMSLLEKVVCLADYIEPNRNYPGLEEIRRLAKQDLNQALALALGGTICFLIEKKQRVYPLTLLAYNDLVKE